MRCPESAPAELTQLCSGMDGRLAVGDGEFCVWLGWGVGGIVDVHVILDEVARLSNTDGLPTWWASLKQLKDRRKHKW